MKIFNTITSYLLFSRLGDTFFSKIVAGTLKSPVPSSASFSFLSSLLSKADLL